MKGFVLALLLLWLVSAWVITDARLKRFESIAGESPCVVVGLFSPEGYHCK